jgi:hypothetical protein
MRKRGNYRTMRKATHLHIKKIHDDQDDYDDWASFALIIMITFVLTGSSWPKVLLEGVGLDDDHH